MKGACFRETLQTIRYVTLVTKHFSINVSFSSSWFLSFTVAFASFCFSYLRPFSSISFYLFHCLAHVLFLSLQPLLVLLSFFCCISRSSSWPFSAYLNSLVVICLFLCCVYVYVYNFTVNSQSNCMVNSRSVQVANIRWASK